MQFLPGLLQQYSVESPEELMALGDGRDFWNGSRLLERRTAADGMHPYVGAEGYADCWAGLTESLTYGEIKQQEMFFMGREGIESVDALTYIKERTGRASEVITGGNPDYADFMNKGHDFILHSNNYEKGEMHHVKLLNRVVVDKIETASGKIIYKTRYYMMDPAKSVGGQYKKISPKKLIPGKSGRDVIIVYPKK